MLLVKFIDLFTVSCGSWQP